MNITMPHAKDLKISMQPDWRTELALHQTEDYLLAQTVLLERIEPIESACCHFCGANDGPYLELHHLNGDHEDYNDSNLVLACSICHRTHHLGLVAYQQQAKIIYLPSGCHFNPALIGVMNRASIFYQYLNPNTPIDTIPFIQQIENINKRFKRTDSYKLWKQKIEKRAQLKTLKQQQQTEILEKSSIKDENERKQALQELSVKHKEALAQAADDKLETIDVIIQQVENEIKEIKSGDLHYLSNGIPILSLADALTRLYFNDEEQSPTPESIEKFNHFFDTISYNKDGQLAMWFNLNVMRPLNAESYLFDEKMRYLITRHKQVLKSRRTVE